jgi:hypothetical protein
MSFISTELPTEFILLVKSISKIIVGKLLTPFIMPITKRITNRKFRRCFSESSETVHFSIALLITVLYRQNHRRIEKSSVLFDRLMKIFD